MFIMRSMALKTCTILATLLLLVGAAAATDIGAGRIKGVNADKKEFVLTDADGKDFTFKMSDKTIINRGGKETKSDLSIDDVVYVQYEKGVLTWTARYVLVQEGDSKNWELHQGKLKMYDAEKENFTYTTDDNKDLTYSAFGARAWINNKECSFDDLKIGEKVLLIVDREKTKLSLKWVMVERS